MQPRASAPQNAEKARQIPKPRSPGDSREADVDLAPLLPGQERTMEVTSCEAAASGVRPAEVRPTQQAALEAGASELRITEVGSHGRDAREVRLAKTCPAPVGAIKACPSLPTAPYVGGNIRDLTLAQLWEETPQLRFARARTTDELWGFCRTCYYADICRGGCSFTAHAFLGKRGNNPLCYHRVKALERQGVRETLVQVEAAPGVPYDLGRFEIRTASLGEG